MSAVPGALADLHLLRPAWLWALAALPLLAWWWHRRRTRGSAWREVVDPHLLPHLLDASAGRRGQLGVLAAALAYVAAVVALAGPSWQHVEQPAWRAPSPLVVALDLSSETTAADLPPSRLLQARAKLDALLARRTGGQVGLVVYADDAFTVAPLTSDTANVALFLDALDPLVMPVDGQRADRAIAWSVRLLRQAGFDQGDILLVAGDAQGAAIDAAAQARADGYRVSVLGLGTAGGSAYRTRAGGIAQARLDAAALQSLAAAGGGRFAALTADAADLQALGVLDPVLRGQSATGDDTPGRHWLDGGFWLLPLVMLLALPAFRRGRAVLAVALLAWLPMRPAAAIDFEDLWQRRDQQVHERLVEGARAYREGDYARAAEAWRALPGAQAQYNLGNALAREGEYREAIDAYERALARQPGMADAIANRDAVQALVDRMSQGDGDEGEDGDEGSEGGSGGADGTTRGRDPEGEAEPGPEGGEPARGKEPDGQPEGDPPSAGDEAQRRADAAQRARMDEALDGAPEDAPDGADPMTDAERERSLANQAWLQRVPDDPGGLLRRKFALEHQRRQREGRP